MDNLNACIFCNSTDTLTREHVLPDWLRTLYPSENLVTNEFKGEKNLQWSSKLFQHKAKIVCRDCNNGWMSHLEMNAKPIITNMFSLSQQTLNEDAQRILSFWVQKTVSMLSQSVPGGLKITHDLYEDIYKYQSFSKKALVTLGWRMSAGLGMKSPIASYSIQQVPSVDVNKEIENQFRIQIEKGGFIWKSTLAIGHLIFEVAGHNMPVSLQADINSKVFTIIQPYAKDVLWPLEWPIDAEGGLEAIKTRI